MRTSLKNNLLVMTLDSVKARYIKKALGVSDRQDSHHCD
jgi:hypothetical protein